MKVKQIATLMNSVFGEVLGNDNLLSEDLSNVVSAGQIITASTAIGDQFDSYAGKIIDKVGRTIFWDRVYEADDLGIWRDSFEYGSVLEKIRCDVGDYMENCEWKLTEDADSDTDLDYNENIASHIAEMFKFYPAKIQAKYFNAKTTLRATISITRKQLRESFRSASALSRFIAMIENRLMTKLEISKMQLQKMTIANLICEHIAQNKQVIDLRALYVAEVDSTAGGMTLQQALGSGRATRFIGQKMAWYREMMKEPSVLYSASGQFFNHTPPEMSRLIVLADLDSALRFNVYGDTYNEEFVKLDGFKTVPFWQSSGTDNSLAMRSGFNVITSNGNAVARSGIIGVLFDRDAAMIANEEPEVRAVYNADGNFTNYMYNTDCSYYNDFDENAVVFTWGAGDVAVTPTLAKGSASGTTVVTAVSPAAASGDTFKYAVSDDAKTAEIGGDTPTSGFSSLTVGAVGTGTAISATAGQVLTVLRINGGKVAGASYTVLTSSNIK